MPVVRARVVGRVLAGARRIAGPGRDISRDKLELPEVPVRCHDGAAIVDCFAPETSFTPLRTKLSLLRHRLRSLYSRQQVSQSFGGGVTSGRACRLVRSGWVALCSPFANCSTTSLAN